VPFWPNSAFQFQLFSLPWRQIGITPSRAVVKKTKVTIISPDSKRKKSKVNNYAAFFAPKKNEIN
jgi:hypothetical protein